MRFFAGSPSRRAGKSRTRVADLARWLVQSLPKAFNSIFDADSAAGPGFVTATVPAVFEILDSDLSNGGLDKDQIQVMTTIHNPANPLESARILRMGGEVKVLPDEPPIAETGEGRVFSRGGWSPGLAVARAFARA